MTWSINKVWDRGLTVLPWSYPLQDPIHSLSFHIPFFFFTTSLWGSSLSSLALDLWDKTARRGCVGLYQEISFDMSIIGLDPSILLYSLLKVAMNCQRGFATQLESCSIGGRTLCVLWCPVSMATVATTEWAAPFQTASGRQNFSLLVCFENSAWIGPVSTQWIVLGSSRTGDPNFQPHGS